MKKFIKEENNKLITPVDYFNFYGSFVSIFEGVKNATIKDENTICIYDKSDKDTLIEPTFILKNGIVEVLKCNIFELATGCKISKFMLLSAVKFKGDSSAATSFVLYKLMKREIPYIRVGTDYFKIIEKEDRYKSINTIIKSWKKDEIKEDHSKQILKHIPKYDDFTIIPNNLEYISVKDNCYNLYSKFAHDQFYGDVLTTNIPTTLHLINHVFGDQWELGLKYMKILYEYPQQILPMLTLVSIERETGKTTFLNWITMIFGENATLINPHDLTSSFNDAYSEKNIIMIDETTIDKAGTIEKLKSIATAKTMSVSKKFVSNYSVPFFGKIILCTNKEKDFMKIDEEEIRFWVRKINPINGDRNVNIELDLFEEIPKFLKFLSQLPEIDFSKSRMVFTNDEIKTDSLEIIKQESHSGVRKEIELLIEDFFNNSNKTSFFATSLDIKKRWFAHNHQISADYIFKIVRDQMKIEPEKMKKYHPFDEFENAKGTGKPFLFIRKNEVFVENQELEENVPF